MATEINFPVRSLVSVTATGGGKVSRMSIDPIVAQIHALREAEWQVFGEDTRAWFDALLQSQAERTQRQADAQSEVG
jgi:DNA-binding protein YbaB